ncbi:MAG TPA: hypothetical protein VGA42_06280, partial [Gemmatimonadales bacterium]
MRCREQVAEGRHPEWFASASQDNGLEVAVDFGRGIPKIRERTCDNGDAVTTVAVRVIEPTTFR